jgi:large subunit ribosomal protein L6
MSRIGKQPVAVPAGVKVAVSAAEASITGPLGTLKLKLPAGVKVTWAESEKAIKVSIAESDLENAAVRALWGSTRAHLRNMVEGVTKGYQEQLEIVGVGWSASMAGKKLKLVVGYANPIELEVPQGVTVTVEKQNIVVKGADRGVVGSFASQVRSKRKPEPYNGKGIKYQNEVIKRKQGKQFGAATA